ncbi:uncharacterized protein NEMAJ01_1229 [Nematocida major]|uniref:uncharacterized protein n=1 Tax=Nematocida major TaxID=1912982 RepID=UPI0020085192|nr:uncharacterized protein NEMAJ01_1229 [Nematocida major]KAH9386333.1 hypothetical protein NEMAJ01_1229 [Nematocida major]
MLYELFFTSLIGASWGAFFFLNELTQHGNRPGRPPCGPIDKDWFVVFYINGAAFFGLLWALNTPSGATALLGIHIFRRLVESSIYSYNHTSTMSLPHLVTGLVYYPLILCRSVDKSAAHVPLFVLGTLAQTVLHYLLFAKRRPVRHLHYLAELLIHSSISLDALNISWIVTFSLINILNRRR